MSVFLLLGLFSSVLLHVASNNAFAAVPSFDAIYQFGDSIADTGNTNYCRNPPYGETSFQHPTGRCSDGLLMIDYFAKEFGFPFLSPYLGKGGDFTHGVNFAVIGATALNKSTLAAKGITATQKNSLFVQLDWFKSHLATICTSPTECKQKLEKALFLAGEIGGNDYNSGAFDGKSMDVLRALVPEVVQAISVAIEDLISLGAKNFIVPGNFPVGCMTVYLALFKTNDTTMYDDLHCLKNWNDLATLHNSQLQQAIKDLQTKHPDVTIGYGDYFSALTSILKDPSSQGFDKDNIQKACCGKGNNEYNYNSSTTCGSSGVPACPDPSKLVSWDGVHLTTHAYQLMADWLLKNSFKTLFA